MTLRGYYDSLPEPTKPQQDFVREVMVRCKVSETTVYNWLSGRSRPSDPRHISVLCEITGLKEDDLWEAA